MTIEDAPRLGDVVGQRVGGSYTVTSLLGEGGMGQVYLATNQMLAGRRAALKLLLHELTRRPEALARFRAEVYAAGKIEDENIVKVFDAGELVDRRLYMLMEYCPGGSLSDLIEQRGALPFELIVTIAAQIGSALDAAHALNITHRDIKPANILLVPQQSGGPLRAKLGDFGIAKLHDDQYGFGMQTGTKKVLGSPGYMAPEQCSGRGAGAVDHRADVYALASVIYEMATGQRPYPGRSAFELITAVASNRPIRKPNELRRDLPPDWAATIMAGLAHRRDDRIQTVKELVRRLARSIPNGEALMSYVAPRLINNLAPPTAPTISDAIGPAATSWAAAHATMGEPRVRRWAVRLVTLAAGIAVGGTGAILLARNAGNAAATPAVAHEREAPAPAAPLGLLSPPPVVAAAAVIAAPAPADAGVPGAPAPAPAVAPDPKEPPRRPDKPPRSVQTAAEPGMLRVEVDPWAEVAIDGRPPTYTTPVTVSLAPGRYRVVLTKGARQEAVDVTITSGKTARIGRTW